MILTVTLNPLLERRITFDTCKIGEQNRGGKEEIKGGGKGINVSRQLNKLGTLNNALTFTGGINGKILKEVCSGEGIKLINIRCEEETRAASIIIEKSKNQISTYFTGNKEIGESEVREFEEKLEKMIQNCEIVIFSGSIPSDSCRKIIPAGIRAAKKYDKVSFLDTYGDHLQECLAEGPTIVHNNREEIERSLGKKLEDDEDYYLLLEELYGLGVKQAYITNGGERGYASNFDFHYSFDVPVVETIDGTGSGDAFSAGILWGWYKDFTFKETLRFAAALGTINASRIDVCNVEGEEAEKLAEKVIIHETGKKIKIINDSPT